MVESVTSQSANNCQSQNASMNPSISNLVNKAPKMQYTISDSEVDVVEDGHLYILVKGARIFSQTAVLEVTEPIVLLASDREEASAFLRIVQTEKKVRFPFSLSSITSSSVQTMADEISAACYVDGIAGAADDKMSDPCCKFQEDASCVICYEDTQPMICFQCSHSICEACFRKLPQYLSNPLSIPCCPSCREPILSASLFWPKLCNSTRQIYLSDTPQVRKLKFHRRLHVKVQETPTTRGRTHMLTFALLALFWGASLVNGPPTGTAINSSHISGDVRELLSEPHWV